MKDELIIWKHPRGLEGLEEKIERLLEKDWKASFTGKTVGPVDFRRKTTIPRLGEAVINTTSLELFCNS